MPDPILQYVKKDEDLQKERIVSDDPILKYVKRESDVSAKARSNVNATQDLDPDMEAKIYDMSKRSGLPATAVREVPEQVSTKLNYPVYTIEDPTLIQEYLGRSIDNAAISRDDVPQLEKAQVSLTQKISRSFQRGVENYSVIRRQPQREGYRL
jgi:hypothetical protein